MWEIEVTRRCEKSTLSDVRNNTTALGSSGDSTVGINRRLSEKVDRYNTSEEIELHQDPSTTTRTALNDNQPTHHWLR